MTQVRHSPVQKDPPFMTRHDEVRLIHWRVHAHLGKVELIGAGVGVVVVAVDSLFITDVAVGLLVLVLLLSFLLSLLLRSSQSSLARSLTFARRTTS